MIHVSVSNQVERAAEELAQACATQALDHEGFMGACRATQAYEQECFDEALAQIENFLADLWLPEFERNGLGGGYYGDSLAEAAMTACWESFGGEASREQGVCDWKWTPHLVSYTARFQAESWVNDYAEPVDPEGETEWDCTEFVTPDVLAYLNRLQGARCEDLDDPIDGVLDNDDVFKDDPNAPEWIREWRGPFTIRVFRESEERL